MLTEMFPWLATLGQYLIVGGVVLGSLAIVGAGVWFARFWATGR